jgi:hypothetical protein
LFYANKGSHDDPLSFHPQGENIDIFDFNARVLTQILRWVFLRRSPNADDSRASKTRRQILWRLRFEDASSSEKARLTLHPLGDDDNSHAKAEDELSPKKRAALRKIGLGSSNAFIKSTL